MLSVELVITVYVIKFSFGSKMVKNYADLGGCYPPQPTTLSEICSILSPEGGGGGNPLYKPYRNVPSQRVWFLGLFLCVKTGIHITHFGLESGMFFEGTTGAYEHIYRFNSKLIRKIEVCEFEMHLKKFLLAL